MPLVSVIVPVYNAQATLPRCVGSVLRQTMADLELVLVDDGSTDGSGSLCNTLAGQDERIRVLHQTNSGPSAARNNGLQHACGTWVVFLDADDAMSPVLLESALLAVQDHPSRMVLWPYTGSIQELPHSPVVQGTPQPFEALGRLQLENLLPMPWNKLYRLESIRRHHIQFDPAYSLGEDLLFCLDYCSALQEEGGAGFFCLAEPLSFYDQQVSGSLTHRVRPDHFVLWRGIYDRLFQACEQTFGCPAEDLLGLHRLVLQTLMAGCHDTLAAAQGPSPRQRRRDVRAILRDPWLHRHQRALAQGGLFSLYEVGIRLRSPRLAAWAFELRETDQTRFFNLQYTGEAIRKKLHSPAAARMTNKGKDGSSS